MKLWSSLTFSSTAQTLGDLIRVSTMMDLELVFKNHVLKIVTCIHCNIVLRRDIRFDGKTLCVSSVEIKYDFKYQEFEDVHNWSTSNEEVEDGTESTGNVSSRSELDQIIDESEAFKNDKEPG